MAENFQIQENKVIRDPNLRNQIRQEGYAILPALPEKITEELIALYAGNHKIEERGMFYTLYSKDEAYRKKIHDGIIAALRPAFEQFFENYKASFNLFIVKTRQVEEEFFIHQDPTYLDESKYSPLHMWIPLCDVGPDSGALCLVPRSHLISYPYRNIAIDPPFAGIMPTVRKYLIPVSMKKGEVLLFDPRMMHNSMPNPQNIDRVAVLSGIFPAEAEIQSVYKDPEVDGAPVEIFHQEEDFFLTYPDFFESCRMRPVMGELLQKVDYPMPPLTPESFESRCKELGIKQVNLLKEEEIEAYCRMFGEPAAISH